MQMRRTAFFLFTCATFIAVQAYGTKTEDDLRAQLKLEQDELAAANRRAETAQAALAAATAAGKVSGSAAMATTAAVSRLAAENQARANATQAATVAGTNQVVTATQNASDQAVASSNSAILAQKASADEFVKILQQQNNGHYAEFGISFVALITLMFNSWKTRKDQSIQGAKITQIHSLVNSNITEMMGRELAVLQANLVLLQKTVSQPETSEEQVVIANIKKQISELSINIEARRKVADAAAAQFQADLSGEGKHEEARS